ncbi:MAG: hypothetical protein EAZ08_05645 [Cytophagales bacterium]|nr:MAG: hypothetical protein EAZ08_05645 [Cytophagales bacterium]
MIVCKPNSSVQIVLFTLLAVAYGITFLLIGYVAGGHQSVWLYIGAVVSIIFSILFTVKVLTGYKTLSIEKDKIAVKYLFRTYSFHTKQLSSWEEIEIKTYNNQVFKQIDLIFGQQKVSFNSQEHSNYDKLVQFLRKNIKKIS